MYKHKTHSYNVGVSNVSGMSFFKSTKEIKIMSEFQVQFIVSFIYYTLWYKQKKL